jgi:NADPH-dependent ferric siderophore reductase
MKKKIATVLAVRAWEPGSIREIDLHMPDCDMSGWSSAQHIKCKVGTLVYRDYTPLGWDAGTSTCTLLIHSGHEGIGSRWARGLQVGDTVSYVRIGSSRQHPSGRSLVFLGDESAIGHFLALRQLAPAGTEISGAVLLGEAHHREEFEAYYPGWGLKALEKNEVLDYCELDRWVENFALREHPDAVFYLAGYIPSVVRLRKLLRRKGVARGRVMAEGFWD